MLRCRKTDHRSIREKAGTVEVAAGKGIGIAAAFAGAALQRLLYFLTGQMVFHRFDIVFVIVQHGTVRIDPCNTVVPGREAVKVFYTIEGHALRNGFGAGAKLLLLHAGKIAVQHPHDKHQ